jgi:hypothetical protein
MNDRLTNALMKRVEKGMMKEEKIPKPYQKKVKDKINKKLKAKSDA